MSEREKYSRDLRFSTGLRTYFPAGLTRRLLLIGLLLFSGGCAKLGDSLNLALLVPEFDLFNFYGRRGIVLITQTDAGTTVSEAGGTDTFNVALDKQPAADVVVSLSIGTEARLNGAVSVDLTFTPTNWSTAQTITVSAPDDFRAEGEHSAAISTTTSSTDVNFNGLTVDSFSAVITDNDTAGIVLSKTGVTVTEAGATETYTAVLSSEPTATVTVAIAFDTTQVTVNGSGTSPVNLTFEPTCPGTNCWSTTQLLTVAAVNDSLAETSPHNVSLSHTASSSDSNYSGLTGASLTAGITDNDSPGVTIAQSGGVTEVSEDGTTDTYTAVLNTQPTATVTVAIAFDTTQVTVNGSGTSPVNLTFSATCPGVTCWSTAQTITVAAVNDGTTETSPASYNITHTATSGDADYNGPVIAAVAALVSDNDGDGWWDTNWLRRRKITFDNSAQAQNLLNIPVLVRLRTGVNIDYTLTQNSGQDIRFTSPAGTPLPYEIESWDETGDSFVWVRVGQIDASSNTDYIYMYYNNTAATDGQNAANTWNNNYGAVWHMAQDPSGGAPQLTDSTGNGYNGTSQGSMTSGDLVTGLYRAIDFDGIDDAFSIPGTCIVSGSSFSVSFWVRPATPDSFERIFVQGNLNGTGCAGRQLMILWHNTGGGHFEAYTRTDGAAGAANIASGTVTDGAWSYITWTFDGTTHRMYVNAATSAGTVQSTNVGFDDFMYIGRRQSSGPWTGRIDELRVSTTARSAAEIAAHYKSMTFTFNTFGTREVK